jgi:hypothetical protein
MLCQLALEPTVTTRKVDCPFVGVFYTGKNMVVKIMHFSSEVVLRSIEHTMIYPGSDLSFKLIALCSTV